MADELIIPLRISVGSHQTLIGHATVDQDGECRYMLHDEVIPKFILEKVLGMENKGE
jgi:hypothetical protein